MAQARKKLPTFNSWKSVIYGESEHRNSVSIKIVSIEYEKEEILSGCPCIYWCPVELACFQSWQSLAG